MFGRWRARRPHRSTDKPQLSQHRLRWCLAIAPSRQADRSQARVLSDHLRRSDCVRGVACIYGRACRGLRLHVMRLLGWPVHPPLSVGTARVVALPELVSGSIPIGCISTHPSPPANAPKRPTRGAQSEIDRRNAWSSHSHVHGSRMCRTLCIQCRDAPPPQNQSRRCAEPDHVGPAHRWLADRRLG